MTLQKKISIDCALIEIIKFWYKKDVGIVAEWG